MSVDELYRSPSGIADSKDWSSGSLCYLPQLKTVGLDWSLLPVSSDLAAVIVLKRG